MRLLCINPNTTRAMTDKVAATLRPHLPEDVEIATETGRFGAPYITDRASFAVGGHAALDALARRASETWDGVMLACFGDPALHALKEVAAVPVIGMAEAAFGLAMRRHRRFSIVTGGPAWEPMLREFAMITGAADRLVSVRTTTATGGDIFRDPAGTRAALMAAIATCVEDGAEAVILGGAGLAGLADGFRHDSALPLIDSLEALAAVTIETVTSHQALGHSGRASPRALEMRSAGWL